MPVSSFAVKVPDLEAATKFYASVFGFKETKTSHERGHVSRHMTDGNIDLAWKTTTRRGGKASAPPVLRSLGHPCRQSSRTSA